MKLKTLLCITMASFSIGHLIAQSIKPDLRNRSLWAVTNREIADEGGNAIAFSENVKVGMMLLKNYEFSEGTIELDIKGRNKLQQSFVGLAFHVQNDSTYDAVYFRPFNFKNEEIPRRSRAVQYISNPKFDWPELRQNFPGKYESKVNPVPDPDDWFHAKIVVSGDSITVYVDKTETASLTVKKLTSTMTGGIALWAGTGSNGSFADLVITPKATRK